MATLEDLLFLQKFVQIDEVDAGVSWWCRRIVGVVNGSARGLLGAALQFEFFENARHVAFEILKLDGVVRYGNRADLEGVEFQIEGIGTAWVLVGVNHLLGVRNVVDLNGIARLEGHLERPVFFGCKRPQRSVVDEHRIFDGHRVAIEHIAREKFSLAMCSCYEEEKQKE